MNKNIILLIIMFVVMNSIIVSQERTSDSGKFVESKSEFRNEMNKSAKKFNNPDKDPKLHFVLDFDEFDLPNNPDEFSTLWHNEPISQGITGTCWCFSSTSLFESEIFRQTGKQLDLSVMHAVYWETVEKARRFVEERGDSHFSQGSMANATIRIWKKYGAVPKNVYNGLKEGQEFHDHDQLWEEMETYLSHIKETSNWNEELVLSTIKSILNYYLGEPPTSFKVDGKKMDPHSYLEKIIKIDINDYVNITSLMEKPYHSIVEYRVPDNWWHKSDYYNIPLLDYIALLKDVIKNGYTVGIGGDVSEAGISAHDEVAMVPSFDIPSDYIDENARQFRFNNRSTTDDHVIHLVGYQDRADGIWFLIKDSGSGGHTGPNPGYFFYHEDYVKLKMMYFIVHKDAVRTLLKEFN